VTEVAKLWRALGSRVVLIHPRRHDRLVAAISHLPHLMAVAAVKTVADFHEDSNFLNWIIAGGFRDTTRVAQGSAVMWNDICATNPGAIVEAIDALIENLTSIRSKVLDTNQAALQRVLEEARSFRQQLDVRE
jgi:prephenate dehydrogenase